MTRLNQFAITAAIALLVLQVGCPSAGPGPADNTGSGGNQNGNANGNENDNTGGGGGDDPTETDRISFTEDAGYGDLVTLAVGVDDLNSDQFDDIVTVAANTEGDDAGTVEVSLSDRTPAFPVTTIASAGNGLEGGAAIVVADLDGGSGPDLVVVDTGTMDPEEVGGVLVLLNSGTGVFADAGILPGSDQSPVDAEVADVDEDQRPDILVLLGEDQNMLSIFAGNGDGTFAAARTLTLPAAVGDIALADVDEDGHLDLLMSLVSDLDGNGLNQAGVQFGDGAGNFSDLLVIDAGVTPLQVGAADMNNDGHLDLVVGHVLDTIYVFPGGGDGTFSEPTRALGIGGIAFATVDVDGDGNLDLVGKGLGAAAPQILYGDGEGGFPEFENFGFGPTVGVTAFSLSDLNNDQKLDLVAVGTLSIVSGMTIENFPIIVKLQN